MLGRDSSGTSAGESDSSATSAGEGTGSSGTAMDPTDESPGQDATSASGETSAGSDTAVPAPSDTGEIVEPRPRVLIYRGNSAVQPAGDSWRFRIFASLLEASGRSVSESMNWPESFSEIGLVLIPVTADPFSASQISDLSEVLVGGGIVIVHDEWSAFAETDNLNALLADLSSSFAFEAGLHANAQGGVIVQDNVGTHALMDGVSSMRVAAGSAVLGCDATSKLLQAGEVCYLAAEPIGRGMLLVSGDANIVDDHVLTRATTQQNLRFIENLISQLPSVE